MLVEAAFVPNDFVPAPRNSILLKAFDPVMEVSIDCPTVPLKVVVPELCINDDPSLEKRLPLIYK